MRKDLEYFLASCQWLDATQGALEEHLAALTRIVRHRLLDRAEAESEAGAAGGDAAIGVAGLPPAKENALVRPGRARRLAFALGILSLLLVLGAVVLYLPWRTPVSNNGGDERGAATTRATQTAADGKIDLLARVNMAEDVVNGSWNRRAEGLFSGPAAGRIRLGNPPAGDYDFHVTFTPIAGDEVVGFILSRSGQGFAFIMGGRGGPSFTHQRRERPLPLKPVDARAVMRNGVRHDVVIKVRKSSVLAVVDGIRVREVATDYSDLEVPVAWDIGPNMLGIATARNVVIHAAEVVPASDTP
jgi:hypothetical protein